MPRFQLSQKFLSIAERFEVKDIDGNVKYIATGSFLSITKSFKVTTESGKIVAEIKQKLFSFRPTFYVSLSNDKQIKIMKTFLPLFKSQFLITYDDNEIIASGNFLAHEFDFTCNNKIIAKVSKKWFSLTDSYGLDVENPVHSELAICILLVIDAIHNGANNNR